MNRVYNDIDWSTAGVVTDNGVMAWKTILSQKLVELGVVSGTTDFQAGWKRFDLGKVDFDRLHSKPQTIFHSADMVARSTSSNFLVLYFQQKNAVIEHDNIRFFAPEGSIALIDNSKPYSIDFPQGSVCLSVRAETNWLEQWLPHPHLATGSAVDGQRPWTAPIIACLKALASDGPQNAAFGRETIADQLGALLAHAFTAKLTAGDTDHRVELYRRARTRISDMCVVHGLSVSDLAREVGISERYLHKLFADRGGTVGASVTEARLQRARSMLQSSQHASQSISTIAWQCGFPDRRHFTRRYRQRFQEAPSDTRGEM